MSLVAALDVGTTTIRLGLFDGDERVALASQKLAMSVPFAGAVEQDAAGFVDASLRLWTEALAVVGASPDDVRALGIANQRATIVCWSASTGAPLRPAVGWQDARTADAVAEMVAQGIPVNTSASCTKMTWLLQNDSAVMAAAEDGTLRMGTVDSWLTWALSEGAAFVTEPGNAAATGMYDPGVGDWSDGALGLFQIPRAPLAEVVASDAVVGMAARLGGSVALAARLGDQMAAAAGHGLVEGQAKLTMGTSAMLNVHAGRDPGPAPDGCYTLPLWRRTIDGEPDEEFMFEGSINTAGSVIEWLVRIGLLTSVEELDSIAADGRVGATTFVPALAGIGSPHHDPMARGEWRGLALDTTRHDMVRGVVDGIADRVAELATVMSVHDLSLDGGLSQSSVLADAIAARISGHVAPGREPEASLRGVASFC